MTEKKTTRSRRPDETDNTALAVPNRGLASMFDEFMQPFMEPFFPSSMRSFWSELGRREPIIDIEDRGDHFTLTAQLPGFSKEEVEVQVSQNSLELKAEKRSEAESKEKEGTLSETSYSYFNRYVTLPEEVLSDKVVGTMRNGILELKLPKMQQKLKGKTRRVDLK